MSKHKNDWYRDRLKQIDPRALELAADMESQFGGFVSASKTSQNSREGRRTPTKQTHRYTFTPDNHS